MKLIHLLLFLFLSEVIGMRKEFKEFIKEVRKFRRMLEKAFEFEGGKIEHEEEVLLDEVVYTSRELESYLKDVTRKLERDIEAIRDYLSREYDIDKSSLRVDVTSFNDLYDAALNAFWEAQEQEPYVECQNIVYYSIDNVETGEEMADIELRITAEKRKDGGVGIEIMAIYDVY